MADLHSKPKYGIRALSSALVDRLSFARHAGFTHPNATGGFDRDVWGTLGYPRILTTIDFREKYERGGIAERVVEALPIATWLGHADVFETEDPEDETPFETAYKVLAKRLKLYPAFKHADILAGLGEYAVIIIGAPGDIESPLTSARADDVVGLWPYAQEDVEILNFNKDIQHARFGLPEMYQVRLANKANSTRRRPTGQTKKIHWSRILHIADGAGADGIYGKPRLRAIWNYLLDLEKVHGAGAEAFWRNANQLVQLDLDPDIELSDEEESQLEDEIDEVRHELRDWIRTRGLAIRKHGAPTNNFSANATTMLTLIAGTTSIPQRMLLGSERGELSSTQDRNNFAKIVNARRDDYAEPQFIEAFIDRMQSIDALDDVEYNTRWLEDNEVTEAEQLTMAGNMSEINARMRRMVFTSSEIRKRVKMQPLEGEVEFLDEPGKLQGKKLLGEDPSDTNEDDDDDDE